MCLRYSDKHTKYFLQQNKDREYIIGYKVLRARGNLLVQDFIAEAERANRTVQKVSGGCGMWELSEYQRANLGKLLLHDIILDQPDANCSTMADVNEDGPFGTRTDIVCKKDIKVSEELTVHAYLLISIHLDVDGEAIVIFISAIE